MEDWKGLIEGVRLHPGLHLDILHLLKDGLDEASQEDIRVVWDALETDGLVQVGLHPEDWDGEERIGKTGGEGG